MNASKPAAKFCLGQVVATPAALTALLQSGQSPQFFLERHLRGDWGELHEEDWKLNDQALAEGGRLLSTYRTLRGEKIWIITEASDAEGRQNVTTLLLPMEY